jgi:hypothetical protein
VSKLGYSKKVGLLSLGSDGSGAQRGGQESLRSQVSDATAQLIDAEVRALMANAYASCRRLLQQHQTSLVTFADELVAREVLLADDIQRLLGQRPLAAQQAAALYDRSDAHSASNAGWTATAQQAKRSRGRGWAAASTASTAPRNPEVAAAVHAVNAALLIEEQAVGRLTNNPASIVSTVSIPASSSSSSSSSISGSKSSGAQSQAAVAATPAPKQPLFAQRLWAQCGGLLAPLAERFGGAGVAFAVAAACGYFRGAI